MLISDEENAIADFTHLWVEIDRIGIQRGGESGGWLEFEVPEELQTVDLTQLTGDAAASLIQTDVPPGEYSKIFAHVDDVRGELAPGEETPVKLPSSKLQILVPFTVIETEVTTFVFDLSVVAAGNEKSGIKYILKPVVAESGADQPYEEKERGGRDERKLLVTVTDPAEAGMPSVVTVTDEAGSPVAGATVEAEIELEPLPTDADGIVMIDVPAGTSRLRAAVELDEAEGELRIILLAELVVPAGATDVEVKAWTEDSRGEGKLECDKRGEESKGRKGSEDRGRDEEDRPTEERTEGGLVVSMEGEALPGAEVTVVVTDASGEPVPGARVEIADEAVGVTGSDGRLSITLPSDEEKIKVDVRRGQSEGELEIEFP